jgi:uncharacterized protein YlaI
MADKNYIEFFLCPECEEEITTVEEDIEDGQQECPSCYNMVVVPEE